jgi:precorrin-6B methylase 2
MIATMLGSLRRLVSELRAVRQLSGWRFLFRYAGTALRVAPAVVRERSLHPVDDALGNGPFTARVFGQTVTLEGASYGLLREIYGRRSYFAPGFELRPGDTVVDLGAHVGTFSVLAARLGADVIAVEADASRVPALEANLRRNGVSATVIQGRIGPSGPITLDELEQIDLLKVDIEGDEFPLFAAGPGWLDRVRRIAMEVHPREGNVDDLVETLRARGFSVELVEPGYLFAVRTGR